MPVYNTLNWLEKFNEKRFSMLFEEKTYGEVMKPEQKTTIV